MKGEHKRKWLKVEGKRKVYVNIEIEAKKETTNRRKRQVIEMYGRREGEEQKGRN